MAVRHIARVFWAASATKDPAQCVVRDLIGELSERIPSERCLYLRLIMPAATGT